MRRTAPIGTVVLVSCIPLALAGCATIANQLYDPTGHIGPGFGVSRELAVTVCGSKEEFDRRVAASRERLKASGSPMPKLGDSMCDVLALIGRPHRQTRVATQHGEAAHWYYHVKEFGRREAVHLVVLVPGPENKGVVESVVW